MVENMKGYKIVIGYQNDEGLRNSFNILSNKTFGLSFEKWYQSGYWKDQYIPYSIVIDGEVIANASVNKMDFIYDGSEKHYIQLGTVMTDDRFRNLGYSRILIEQILTDYKKYDGIYLFANDSVVNFYPKFGFFSVNEYQYIKQMEVNNITKIEPSISKLNMEDSEIRESFITNIKNMIDYNRIEMKNDGLLMFYLLYFMKDNVYYIKDLEAYIIAEQNNFELFIHAVYAKNYVSLSEICRAFKNEIRNVVLGFTPKNIEDFTIRLLKEEDTTLFVLGDNFTGWNDKHLMFSTLSHA